MGDRGTPQSVTCRTCGARFPNAKDRDMALIQLDIHKKKEHGN